MDNMPADEYFLSEDIGIPRWLVVEPSGLLGVELIRSSFDDLALSDILAFSDLPLPLENGMGASSDSIPAELREIFASSNVETPNTNNSFQSAQESHLGIQHDRAEHEVKAPQDSPVTGSEKTKTKRMWEKDLTEEPNLSKEQIRKIKKAQYSRNYRETFKKETAKLKAKIEQMKTELRTKHETLRVLNERLAIMQNSRNN